MDEKLRAILAELRRQLGGLYGERLVHLILYGSRARGDAEPDSDIDVLVVLKGPVDVWEEIQRTSEVVGDLSLDRDVVISCFYMDESRFLEREGPFLRNVRREGVLL